MKLPFQRAIATRLVLLFAGAALVTFALIGTALYGVLASELARHQDDELSIDLQNMQYSIDRAVTLDRWTRVQAKMDTLTPADGSLRFWVLSDDPRFQYGKGLGEIERMSRGPDGRGTIVLPPHSHQLRTVSRRIPAAGERPDVLLIVGGNTAPYLHTLDTFLTALAALTLTAVLLVIGVGYWVARVGLRPLQQLSREAQALSPKTLSARLGTAALPVELSDLAHAFNGALGRLEEAYGQLEAFNADVAHELRTPLANLIGGTQVALSRQRSGAEFQEVLQSNLEELERLSSIINDMLFLARADRGEAPASLLQVPIAHEVEKTVEFFEFVLDEMEASVQLQGDAAAEAPIETSLFRRAMTNLLQNAIEHSERGARLAVRIRQEAAATWILVANPGQPIADAHLPRLFDRFYRVDAARNGQGEHHGHGLGLAIVKAVATMHGGGVMVTSAGGFNTFGFSVATPGRAQGPDPAGTMPAGH